ncbi:hypothetical protein E2562_025936 [Oryza meyeriana var. granulata]|uniref:Uncharacterized protein n=1 Tax=Oryza meyeriana var. granulata TaxID=110450 RepID=A0A6G1EYP6_9ORYZ|nr:hypothetical protein E2562_025936 [Oryza meyeriana var. granulata]
MEPASGLHGGNPSLFLAKMAATGEPPSMEEKDLCVLFKCFCCWREALTEIRRIAPGTDYLAIPAGADDRPLWSVVVGVTAADVPRHNLRLHRFRVAASGRVLGESDDILESFRQPHRSLSMNLADGEVTPLGDLPTVPVPRGHFPIQAGGENWVLSVELPYPWLDEKSTTRLLMRRQKEGHYRWVVAAEHEFPHTGFELSESFQSGIFQGHAVIGDDKIWSYVEDADRVEPLPIPPVLGEAIHSEIEDSPNMLQCCSVHC